jgi:hypothetical protein
MTRRFLVNLFLQLACLLPYVRGYAIGDACKNYKRKNLYNEIKAAMQEAYDMAVLGYHHVAEPYDLLDNTKWELYYEASQEHLETVKGMYACYRNEKAFKNPFKAHQFLRPIPGTCAIAVLATQRPRQSHCQ